MLKQLYKFLFVDDLIRPSANPVPVKMEPVKNMLLRDLARITLCSYILLVFNPLMPLVTDKMAHTFWLEYHLVTVHHVYGNAHLQLEMANSARQADKDKSQGNSKPAADEYVHIVPNAAYNFLSAYFISIPYSSYKINPPVSYSTAHYQPPKC